MADNALTGQYSVIAPFLENFKPAWLSNDIENQNRVAAYNFYSALFWNDAGGFKMTLRGDEEFPVYIPSARRIVNTYNRYVAKEMDISVTSESNNEEQILLAKMTYYKLFSRERFLSKFQAMKKQGLTRGDWILGLFADPLKPEGRRISMKYIDPGKYFPLTNPRDDEEVWGQSLIEPVTVGDKQYINIQRWLKYSHPEHPNTGDVNAPIVYEDVTYEQENWNDPAKRKSFSNPDTDVPMAPLEGIFTLPLYHFRADWEPGNKFGTSALKGLERIILAINQTATDEDVAVAMAGLGLYAADATPVDDDGAPTDWVIGPKRVVEMPSGGKFERVSGIASVEPTQGHMDWMQSQADSVLGISDVALGQADVQTAESGIALAIRMAPLLDAARLEDEAIYDILLQLFYDLKTWFKVYESVDLGDDITGVVVTPIFGDKLPKNAQAEFERLTTMLTNKSISLDWYWEQLIAIGYDIDPKQMREEMLSDAELEDPTGARLTQEAGAPTDGSGPE